MKANEQGLLRDVATATAIRTPWHAGVAANLTPARLATILRQAAEGDLHAYLTLAEEMEERDPHYASVLRTRKLAVSSLPLQVLPASIDANARKQAEEIQALVNTPAFSSLIDHALDGLGKGYSVSEILWDTTRIPWRPSEYRWCDPRYFTVPRSAPYSLHLVDESNLSDGIALPPYKFVIHQPKLKSGLPFRGGLARLVAFAYVCKMYGLKDWLSFLEVYGIPLRLGKYGAAASEEDKAVLKMAVANIGADAAAILPESMQIEFQQVAQAAGGSDVFASLVEWLDKQVSKAVLGQTATTEGTPGRLGSDATQEEVRQDLIAADAKQLADTLNRDVVKSYIDINYGVQPVYPRIVISIPEQEDIAALADNLAKLVPLGLKVSMQEVRQKLGLSAPASGEEILQGLTTTTSFDTQQNAAEDTSRALNREESQEIENELANWQPQTAALTTPIFTALQQATSYEELNALLPLLLQQMDVTELQQALTAAGFIAYAEGME